MKRYIFILLTMFCANIIFVSCSSRQNPINKLEDLAFELNQESSNYSAEDWEEVAVKLSDIEDELSEYEYSDEELREIGKLKAQCLKAIAKSSANVMKNQLHNLQMQLEGAADELQGFDEELESIFGE